MADCRQVTEYGPLVRHRQEIAQQRKIRRLRLGIAVPLTLLLLVWAFSLSPPLALLLGGVCGLFLFFLALPGASSVDPGALAGVEGEVAVLKQLQSLTDDFQLINRVHLPDDMLPNGERELDFIVLGPTGLWVIEVKNTPGHIRVTPEEKHWPMARRAGCGSSPSWNAIPNPIPQARSQVESLQRWLLMQGIVVDPQAAVVMAHPETLLTDAEQSPIPVLLRHQVIDTLRQSPELSLPDGIWPALQRLRGD